MFFFFLIDAESTIKAFIYIMIIAIPLTLLWVFSPLLTIVLGCFFLSMFIIHLIEPNREEEEKKCKVLSEKRAKRMDRRNKLAYEIIKKSEDGKVNVVYNDFVNPKDYFKLELKNGKLHYPKNIHNAIFDDLPHWMVVK
jgi:ABC-type bacteriocin/lantibiotic exporter with double-glycine peptidase domain